MKKTLTLIASAILSASAILIALLTLFGCTSSPSYIEGTSASIGAYVPYNGNLWGIELCQFMTGCKVSCVSNQAFKVDRTYASTNEYFWGMVKTQEHTKTKVEVLQDKTGVKEHVK